MQESSEHIKKESHFSLLWRNDFLKPYGPFTDQKILFNVPYAVDKIGNQYYKNLLRVNLHLELAPFYEEMTF